MNHVSAQIHESRIRSVHESRFNVQFMNHVSAQFNDSRFGSVYESRFHSVY